MTEKSKLLIKNLCDSAMSWGWLQDQGTGFRVTNAEKEYHEDLKALQEYVFDLEEKIQGEKNE